MTGIGIIIAVGFVVGGYVVDRVSELVHGNTIEEFYGEDID